MIVQADTIALVATISSALTEVVKRELDKAGKKYSSPIVASIVSSIVSIVWTLCKALIEQIPFSGAFIGQTLVLIALSILCATTGYDFVKKVFKL